MESVEHLRHLEFPHSTQLALQYIEQHCRNPDSAPTEDRIPGLGGTSETFTQELATEFVFFQSPRGQKLSAIQEFQLIELLCNYFHEQKDGDKAQAIFYTLFDNQPEWFQASQFRVLSSLVSMGVAMKGAVLLDCAATWIQRHGYNNQNIKNLIRDLVKDYCLLIPGTSSVLDELPEISAKFACSFIAVTTAMYNMSDPDMPYALLALITKWVEEDSTLCQQLLPPGGHSLKADRTKTAVLHTPILGILSWSVLIPIYQESRTLVQNRQQQNGTKLKKNAQVVVPISDSGISAETMCSRLHLGLLQSILAIGTSSQIVQEHLHIQDVLSLAERVTEMKSERMELKSVVETGIERLLQALQVAIAVKACRCQQDDLKKLSKILPQTRLLDILHQRLNSPSTSHEPMEF